MTQGLGTLIKGLRVLEAVCLADEPSKAAALSRRLDVNLSTITRILASYQQVGLMDRLTDGSFRPSAQLVDLIGRWAHLLPPAVQQRQLLEGLRTLTGETVYLVRRSGDQRLVVYSVEGAHDVSMRMPAGLLVPLLAGATGYALLADSSPNDIDTLRRKGLEAFPPDLLLSAEQHETIMARRNRARYFVTGDDLSSGRTVGVPVRDQRGRVVLALGVGGPVNRWTRSRIDYYLPHILHTADQLGSAAGE